MFVFMFPFILTNSLMCLFLYKLVKSFAFFFIVIYHSAGIGICCEMVLMNWNWNLCVYYLIDCVMGRGFHIDLF